MATNEITQVRRYLPDPFEYSPAELSSLSRQLSSITMGELLHPYQACDDSEEERALDGLPCYQVMIKRVVDRATTQKPDMRAVEFLQEHVQGKAIQRVQAETTTFTYQDLRRKTEEAEARYQAAIVKVAEQVVQIEAQWKDTVPDAAEKPAAPDLTWDDLI